MGALIRAIAFAVVFLFACSGPQRAPRTPTDDALIAVHSLAHGLSLADGLVAPHCGVASPSPACSDFVASYGIARVSLVLAESAARDWQSVGGVAAQCRFAVALRLVVRDSQDAVDVLAALHITPPPEAVAGVSGVLALVAAYLPACGSDGGAE